MSDGIARKLGAEFIGTAFLLATIVGSGIMAETLAPKANVAVALLSHSLAIGGILYVLITMLGPISGAHFNPAVTLVFRLRGEMQTGDAVAYVVVQIVAAMVGVWMAHMMFDQPLWQLSEKVRVTTGQRFSEVVATFGLLFTILMTIKARDVAVPSSVALYITAALWFTHSTSFANPAVTIARALTNTFSGIQYEGVFAFIAAQIAGAVLAMWVASLLGAGAAPAEENAGERQTAPAE